MQNKYKIQVTKTAKKTGSATAYLLEDGSQIARVTRAYRAGQVTFKWFSERARDRFSGYSDCLSMEETVEAMGFPT